MIDGNGLLSSRVCDECEEVSEEWFIKGASRRRKAVPKRRGKARSAAQCGMPSLSALLRVAASSSSVNISFFRLFHCCFEYFLNDASRRVTVWDF